MKVDVCFYYKGKENKTTIEISDMLLDTFKQYATINNVDLNDVLQQYLLYSFSEDNDAILKRM